MTKAILSVVIGSFQTFERSLITRVQFGNLVKPESWVTRHDKVMSAAFKLYRNKKVDNHSTMH